jgi:putative hemolysin
VSTSRIEIVNSKSKSKSRSRSEGGSTSWIGEGSKIEGVRTSRIEAVNICKIEGGSTIECWSLTEVAS